MYKQILTAASLALCLAGSAAADDDRQRGKVMRESPSTLAKASERRRDDHRDRDRDDDRRDRRGHDRDDDRHDRRGHDRDDDRNDWRGHDRDRDRNDWRDHDRRRDDDWRRRGWRYDGWRNDGWRYYRGHDNRHWRYVPPHRYSIDFGYRSGYELAWRDWLNHGRHDRYWRRSSFYGYGSGHTYRSGYEAGWRDAAIYYGRGYRPNYWSYDPHGGWFFGFSISG
jgi:hypothetical protein